jgi:hypothetical protein
MAIDISETLYRRKDIRLSTRIAAEELAKAARPDGTVIIAYPYLAYKMNVCKRTAFRAIANLGLKAQIIAKRVRRRKDSALHEINIYKFTCKFRRPSAHPFSYRTAHQSNGDISSKMASTPKNPEEERKEDLRSLREEIRIQEKMLRILDLTPGSIPYEELAAKIARLQARLAALTSASAEQETGAQGPA